jgi:hypothetical protein
MRNGIAAAALVAATAVLIACGGAGSAGSAGSAAPVLDCNTGGCPNVFVSYYLREQPGWWPAAPIAAGQSVTIVLAEERCLSTSSNGPKPPPGVQLGCFPPWMTPGALNVTVRDKKTAAGGDCPIDAAVSGSGTIIVTRTAAGGDPTVSGPDFKVGPWCIVRVTDPTKPDASVGGALPTEDLYF